MPLPGKHLPAIHDSQNLGLQMAVEVGRSKYAGRSMPPCPLGGCCPVACRVTEASLISQMNAIEHQNCRPKRIHTDLTTQEDLLKKTGKQ